MSERRYVYDIFVGSRKRGAFTSTQATAEMALLEAIGVDAAFPLDGDLRFSHIAEDVDDDGL